VVDEFSVPGSEEEGDVFQDDTDGDLSDGFVIDQDLNEVYFLSHLKDKFTSPKESEETR
jgi:hypothetical protein